jgi:hypothetical protein
MDKRDKTQNKQAIQNYSQVLPQISILASNTSNAFTLTRVSHYKKLVLGQCQRTFFQKQPQHCKSREKAALHGCKRVTQLVDVESRGTCKHQSQARVPGLKTTPWQIA